MTRKDFKLIASVLKKEREEWLYSGDANIIASDFAEALATTNPNFDKSKFLEACGV